MKKVLFIFILSLVFLPVLCLAEQVDINSATLPQLDDIVHVGDKTAQKIIDDRPYNSVQDLSRVKGIGNGKYLQDIISQGFACVNCQTKTVSDSSLRGGSQADVAIPNTEIASSPEAPRNDETINYPSGVFINEIMPDPKGPDGTDEWIVPTIQQIASAYS